MDTNKQTMGTDSGNNLWKERKKYSLKTAQFEERVDLYGHFFLFLSVSGSLSVLVCPLVRRRTILYCFMLFTKQNLDVSVYLSARRALMLRP